MSAKCQTRNIPASRLIHLPVFWHLPVIIRQLATLVDFAVHASEVTSASFFLLRPLEPPFFLYRSPFSFVKGCALFSCSDGPAVPRETCRFYQRGNCTWGDRCRFIHPGVNDKGKRPCCVRNTTAGDNNLPHVLAMLTSLGSGLPDAAMTSAARQRFLCSCKVVFCRIETPNTQLLSHAFTPCKLFRTCD